MKIVTLNKEDERELLEIARIQDDNDFLTVIAMIRRARNKARDMAEKLSGEHLYKALGGSIILGELLEAFEDAKTIIDTTFSNDDDIENFD